MSERKGTKALELWCRKVSEGYPGVKVENMTTSWRDGLAFCAIIHHFRPELIDFSKLNKDNVFYNNELAFTVAEKYLGIPALLEPEDMEKYDVPDRLSILTYLSQFYRTFMTSQGTSPVRTVPKRPASVSSRGVGAGSGGGIGSPTSASPPTKMAVRSAGIPRREPCAKCGNPVYIAERLTVGKQLYHRTCFRCARCNSQLTLANYYETETSNQFCCETCPDEEKSNQSNDKNKDQSSVLSRSLSDEEKSAGLKKLTTSQEQDMYSTSFETALESSDMSQSLEQSKYSEARSQFLTAQLNSSDGDSTGGSDAQETPPELPKTKPPSPDFKSNSSDIFVNKVSNISAVNESPNSNNTTSAQNINNKISSSENRDKSNSVTVQETEKSKSDNQVTKESLMEEKNKESENRSSLVKARMKLFEKAEGNQKSVEEENLKRPLLTDATTIQSPVKKITNFRPKSENLDMREVTKGIQEPVSPKINRSSALVPPKSLNFMLHKQIALREGKISPMKLINEAKQAESTTIKEDETKKDELSPVSMKKSIEIDKKVSPDDKATKKSPLLSIQRETKPKIAAKISSPTKTNADLSIISNLDSKNEIFARNKESKSPIADIFRKKPPDLSPQKNEPKKNVILQTSFLGSSNYQVKKDVENSIDNKSPITKSQQHSGLIANRRSSMDRIDSVSKIFQLKNRDKNIRASDTALNTINLKQEREKSPLVKAELIKETRRRSISKDYNREGSISPKTKSIENLYRSRSAENIALKNINSENKMTSLISYWDKMETTGSQDKLSKTVGDDNDISEYQVNIHERIQTQNVSEILQTTTPDQPIGEILRDRHLNDDGPTEETEAVKEEEEPVNVEETNGSDLKIEDEISTSLEVKRDYPEDLNPFGDDENETRKEISSRQTQIEDSKGSLNPFDDEDDNEEDKNINQKPTPAIRKKILHAKTADNSEKKVNTNPFEDDDEIDDDDDDDDGGGKETGDKKYIIPNLDKSAHEGDTPEFMQRTRIKRISINPFEQGNDDDHLDKKYIIPNLDESVHEGDTPEFMQRTRIKRISINPFEQGNDDDHLDKNEEPSSNFVKRKLTVISPPKISLSPCWSDADEEENEYEDENVSLSAGQLPIPKPRKSRSTTKEEATASPIPAIRKTSQGSRRGSNSSLSSCQSTGHQSTRKKKPAPRPPILPPTVHHQIALTETTPNSQTSSPNSSLSLSPRLGAKNRKMKKAPPLPSFTSTPFKKNDDLLSQSTIAVDDNDDKSIDEDEEKWNNEKTTKDLLNENKRNQHFSPNKSTYGKWKRKKGPAPSRPVPQKRLLKALPVAEFRRELDLIELQKQGLEKQGVRLEQIIRDRCEGPDSNGEDKDTSFIPIDVEDLILQLFEVVNEKNELSRREAELMYIQRQQRLEQEHVDVEYQIRCLMMQPEANKTDSDKAKEEELIQRLIDIVERRNEIVECLEMDRLREAEEDDSISSSLNSYASRREDCASNKSLTSTTKGNDSEIEEEVLSKKEKKKLKKNKKNKKKNSGNIDVDKDIDENDTASITKEKKKKKFSLF